MKPERARAGLEHNINTGANELHEPKILSGSMNIAHNGPNFERLVEHILAFLYALESNTGSLGS